MRRAPKTLVVSLGVTLAVWTLMSWPLPRHFRDGIPAAANSARPSIRYMIPGDHLQLLYHFWLAGDVMAGKTPLYHDLYEFNTGRDKDTYQRMDYFAPFSIAFGLLMPWMSHAAAWNLTSFLSIWLTFFITWRLVRRYVSDLWVSGAAAAVSILLPYRWIALCGGSPTGFGMMWIPLILLGIEWMAVNFRPWGGAVAGASIYLSGWTDTHTFAFGAMATPLWCLFAWLSHRGWRLPTRPERPRLFRAALPLAAFLVLVALRVVAIKSKLSTTSMSHGRGATEVALHSIPIEQAFAFQTFRGIADTYVGLAGLLAAVFGVAVLLRWRRGDKPEAARARWTAVALCLAIGAVVVLATGTRMPGGVGTWRTLTHWFPPYGMIRQPVKVYCLLPTFLAVAFALCWRIAPGPGPEGAARSRAWAVALTALIALDAALRLDVSVCLLDREQGAYRAIAEEARAAGALPRALALPLWPGNSHWTSLELYDASLYRIRMVNGYMPAVSERYLAEIFRPFESMARGEFPNASLDDLLRRGVRCLVLRENAFPEVVSPFGVSHTLACMLAHPRLRFLAQDKEVWAFRILGEPQSRDRRIPDWPYTAPSRVWEMERMPQSNGIVRTSATAGSGRYLQLAASNAWVETKSYPLRTLTNLCFRVLGRGDGEMEASILADGAPLTQGVWEANSTEWRWFDIPVPRYAGSPALRLRVERAAGAVDLDIGGLFLGGGVLPGPDGRAEIPAPVFFHSGYTDRGAGEVVFERERERRDVRGAQGPKDVIFYGPNLPLDAGDYRVEFRFRSPSPAGTVLGRLTVFYPNQVDPAGWIVAGKPAVILHHQPTPLPFILGMAFTANGDLRIRSVTIERVVEAR